MLGAEVVSCERDGSRVTSVATRAAGHDARYAAPWFVLAAGGFDSGAIELDSRWATHERVLGLPLRGRAGAGRAAVRRRLPGRAADGPGRGGGRRRAAGRGCGERASWPAPRCRGRCRGARARARGSRWRAARTPLSSCSRGRALRRERRHERGPGGVLEELMRGSLDHCVKCTICETQCPVSNVTPLFPGPKYAGPQAERYRDRRRAVGRRLGRLLLGLRDLLDVLPAGGEDRRDQLPGAQQAQAAEGHPAPRPDHHAPDVARARGHAGRAARQLHDRFPAVADPRGEAAQGPPRRGGAGVRRPALLALVQEAPEPRDRAQDRLLPRLRHRVLRAVGGREGRGDPRAQRVRGRSSPSRTAAACRCSRAGCSTTRARSCCASRASSRRTCATTRTRSSSATRPAAR